MKCLVVIFSSSRSLTDHNKGIYGVLRSILATAYPNSLFDILLSPKSSSLFTVARILMIPIIVPIGKANNNIRDAKKPTPLPQAGLAKQA
jgi:hypothetical protein